MRVALLAVLLSSVASAQDIVKRDNAPEAWAIGSVEAKWADSGSPRYGSGVMVGPDLVLTQLECMDKAIEAKFSLPCCGDHPVLGIVGIYEKEHVVLLKIQKPDKTTPMRVSDQVPDKGQGWHFSITLVEDTGVLTGQFRVLDVREWPADGVLAWTRMPQSGFKGSGVALDDQKHVRGLSFGSGGNKTTLFSMVRPEMATPGQLIPLAEFAQREPSTLIQARRLANSGIDKGDASGLAEIREALKLEPGLWRAQWYIGVILDLSGNPDAALAELAKSVELTPWYSEPLYSTALIHFKNKRFEEAVSWFDKAAAADSEYAAVHGMKALALFEMGKHDEAIASGRRATQCKPHEWKHYSNLVVLFKRMGKPEEGLEVLRTFCRDEPDDVRGWDALAHHLIEQDDFKEAEAVALDGLKHINSPRLYRQLLHSRVRQENAAGALEALKKILELDPDAKDKEKLQGIAEFLEAEIAKNKEPAR